MRKKVVLLNGPSSSGKSTLSVALQKGILCERSEEFGVISIDDFLKMTVSETIYEEDVYNISVELYMRAIEILGNKDGIIIDHVITSERIFYQLIDALNAFDIYLVRVTCPVSELIRREKLRGNRCLGSAEASQKYLFPKDNYDSIVDTFKFSADECSSKIVSILKNKPNRIYILKK